jgi:hypothetical protein
MRACSPLLPSLLCQPIPSSRSLRNELSQLSGHLHKPVVVCMLPVHAWPDILQRSGRREIVLSNNKTEVSYDGFFNYVIERA